MVDEDSSGIVLGAQWSHGALLVHETTPLVLLVQAPAATFCRSGAVVLSLT
mgnify:FL=1|jgi:hypothetical protein